MIMASCRSPLIRELPRILYIYGPMLLLFATTTFAWIPPPPGVGDEWEPVEAMRKRAHITFDYQPTSLHPELCRYLTAKECQTADESMQQHAASLKQIQSKRLENPSMGKFKVGPFLYIELCCYDTTDISFSLMGTI